MRRIDLRGVDLDGVDLGEVLPRAALDVEAAVGAVRPIVDAVRTRGDEALLELAERFDGVRPPALRVPPQALADALAALDLDVRAALDVSIARARLVHADQRRTDVTTQVVPGGSVTERWVPVQRVGLYVPGGLAPLVSSVVMNVVPAQAAGVPSIAVASPPQRDNGGLPDAGVLAACALLGVEEVYAVGGAQAIAMFAYGTQSCPKAPMVTGPGNIYVVAAKRLLRGRIAIDSEAGPTEIAILADVSANPAILAADLISQAEHDTVAASVLVTDDLQLADAVEDELENQAEATKHTQRITTALSGQQSAIVLVDDLEAGIRVVDAYAAEHLEIQTEESGEVAARIRNAGAIFVGPYSPVSLGDYAAGSNHVLPTGGCACHSGGLSVQTFLRGIHVIDYDEAALAATRDTVVALAHAEDLPAHGAAVDVRFRR